MTTRKKTGGRVAGTPNRTTAETKDKLLKIVGNEIDNLGRTLAQLEPSERINAICKLLPYLLPRQTESTIKGDKENPLITIENTEARKARIAELIAKAQL